LVPYQVLCAVVYLTGPPQPDRFAMEVPGNPASRVGLRITVEVVNVPGMEAAATLEAVAQGTISRAALPFVPLMRGADDSKRVERWREVTGAFPNPRERATLGFLALTLAKLVAWSDVWNRGMEGWAVEESPYWAEIRAGMALSNTREILLELLKERFGESVALELTPRVNRTNDLPILNQCLRQIVPGDLDKVRALLGGAN
jgi:hypothetical protein